MSEIVIETNNLSKVFKRDEFQVTALDNCRHRGPQRRLRRADGTIGLRQITLLHLIAAMDRPTDGAIGSARRRSPRALNDRQIARWRNEHIGFIFQSFNLIPVLTALENVELPLKLTKLARRSAENTRRRR